jgi:hypothetical protein
MGRRQFPPNGCARVYLRAKDETRDDTVCACADMGGAYPKHLSSLIENC